MILWPLAFLVGIPETSFISPDGLVVGRHVGAIDQETLTNGIEAIRRRPASFLEHRTTGPA